MARGMPGLQDCVSDGWLEELTAQLKAEAKAELQHATLSRHEWERWCDTALDGGASAAHAWTRNQHQWEPEAVMSNGQKTTQPCEVLRHHTHRLKGIWRAESCGQNGAHTPPDPPSRTSTCIALARCLRCPRLPPIASELIRDAARTFKSRTAVADGWHPRTLRGAIRRSYRSSGNPSHLRGNHEQLPKSHAGPPRAAHPTRRCHQAPPYRSIPRHRAGLDAHTPPCH